MPFPKEDTTPPVTNTYFVMAAYDTGKGPFEQIGDNGKAAFAEKTVR
jgi:hypothetical protein